MRIMTEQGILIPYKEKPIPLPLNMFELLKADRAGHTFDPKVGFHKNVAELDFSSLFPWLIYNGNISAETILCEEGPFRKAPGLPLKTSLKYKGLVPQAIKPLLDRRMHYKRHPTALNKSRAVGLKWVLVTSYGYLRFREFKMGIPQAHMIICAHAREVLLRAMHMAEERGFEVIHGIIDSLYVKKDGITKEDVDRLCKDLEVLMGIPVSNEGIFKWLVLLPSVVDPYRPVPTRYYGTFKNGDFKARGIEVRQRSTPLIVKYYQQKVLEQLSTCSTHQEIREKLGSLCSMLRQAIREIQAEEIDPRWLECRITVGTEDYKHNIPQKHAVDKIRTRGIKVMPGQKIRYIYSKNGIMLPEDYDGQPDLEEYRKLLVRALYAVLQPFGITKETIINRTGATSQVPLTNYLKTTEYSTSPCADDSPSPPTLPP